MSRPILSIVVVTFNDLEGLQRTISSLAPVLDQAADDVEVLVQDGGTRGVEGLIFPGQVRLQSEPDRGTYDAMNAALARSTGDFVWFLNGGDESLVADWGVLVKCITQSDVTLGAYRLDFDGVQVRRQSRSPGYIWHALPTSHQAIVYPGNLARDLKYDLRFRISADYDFTARMLKTGARCARTQVELARFHVGGSSLVAGEQVALDAERVQRETLNLPGIVRLLSAVLHRTSLSMRRRRMRSVSQ